MELIFNKVFLEHDTGDRPENKKRLEAFGGVAETALESGEKYLELVHTREYIDHVKRSCKSSEPLDVDTVTSPGSFNAAAYAVSAAVLASQTNGFALVRPPGHHAYPSRGTGFCLFNNMAIAAQKLANEGKKVAIIDIDGHYGDGTAYQFYNNDKVLFCSLHQFPAFPGLGNVDETGEGKGKGYTVNVALPAGSSDDIFLHAIEKIIIPVTDQFQPDIVGISAGFDAYRYDPLLQLNVSLNGFYKAGVLLGNSFNNIFACLEGGYDLQGLQKCLLNFLNGIYGKPALYEEDQTISEQSIKAEYGLGMDMLLKNLSAYWKI